MGPYHIPVMLEAVCRYLMVKPGQKYIDATLGGGGHAAEIIRRGGLVLGLDQDTEAISASPELEGLIKVRANFAYLAEVTRQYDWTEVAGILFDLGVASHHLDEPKRGFSFQTSGPLDMRMDKTAVVTAADLVNQLPADSLARLFKDFGDVPVAKAIAARIVAARPVTTTDQLSLVLGKWSRQAFQAIRIAVNNELGALETALPQAGELLARGGRLVVIAYHSLEDRLVKRQFLAWARSRWGTVLTPRPVRPERAEVVVNPRSKSAKLRAFSKL